MGECEDSLARVADAFVQRREERREAILLLRDSRSGRRDAIACLNGRLPHPFKLGTDG